MRREDVMDWRAIDARTRRLAARLQRANTCLIIFILSAIACQFAWRAGPAIIARIMQ